MVVPKKCFVLLLMLQGSLLADTASADDYSLSLSHKLVSPTASSLDASYDLGDGQLDTTAIASLNPRGVPGVVRLESAWLGELPGVPARLKLGDSVSNPGAWGSAVRFAGLQIGTPFAMRSDVVSSPGLALPGIAVLPTRAESMFASADAIAAGRTVAFNPSFLPRPVAAPAGCGTYSMSVGRVREDYALQTSSYGPLFANTTVTCGLDPGLALEAHGEYLKGASGVAGLNLTQRLGSLVAASVGVAGSDNDLGRGWSVRMGLNRSSERFELDLRGRLQSQTFRELSADPMQDEVAGRLLASVAAKLSARSKLGLAYAVQRSHEMARLDIVALSQTFAFDPRTALSIVANRAVNDQSSSSINLSFVRKGTY